MGGLLNRKKLRKLRLACWGQAMWRFLQIAAFALTVLATEVLAQSPTPDNVGACGGILHVLKPRLWVGSAKAEIAEDLPCFIVQSEVEKVLSVCAVGRWCEVAGVIDFNCDPGKCEISKVTSVSRRKKR